MITTAATKQEKRAKKLTASQKRILGLITGEWTTAAELRAQVITMNNLVKKGFLESRPVEYDPLSHQPLAGFEYRLKEPK